jgi:F0F1-type ATP synthase assembly protein I
MGVRGKVSLLLTFIVGIYNVIKKYDTVKNKGSYWKTRYIWGNDRGFDEKDE